jgi:hypothetical protein
MPKTVGTTITSARRVPEGADRTTLRKLDPASRRAGGDSPLLDRLGLPLALDEAASALTANPNAGEKHRLVDQVMSLVRLVSSDRAWHRPRKGADVMPPDAI